MRDDVISEALALERLAREGWNFWITARKEGHIVAGRTVNDLLQRLEQQKGQSRCL
jgi:hypothetical protein